MAFTEKITLLQPAIMMNLLGQDVLNLQELFSEHPEWHVHIYGKRSIK